MITYYKLFDLLNRREMKKTDLLKVISSPTLAKLSNNETITTTTIDKICQFLGVQPNSIMESYRIVNNKKIKWDLDNSDPFNMFDEEMTLIAEEKDKIIEKCLIKKENYYCVDVEKYAMELRKVIDKTTKAHNGKTKE